MKIKIIPVNMFNDTYFYVMIKKYWYTKYKILCTENDMYKIPQLFFTVDEVIKYIKNKIL